MVKDREPLSLLQTRPVPEKGKENEQIESLYIKGPEIAFIKEQVTTRQLQYKRW